MKWQTQNGLPWGTFVCPLTPLPSECLKSGLSTSRNSQNKTWAFRHPENSLTVFDFADTVIVICGKKHGTRLRLDRDPKFLKMLKKLLKVQKAVKGFKSVQKF